MGEEKIEGQLEKPTDNGIGDVLIVGAGISGIQAALDLANKGFKVYLIDKSPAIGGKMSQLDKTFPTNDCSMCIESPEIHRMQPASEHHDYDLHRGGPG